MSWPDKPRRFERRSSRTEFHPTTEDLIERAVNEARKLPSYDAHDEESTARHNIPKDIHFHVHPSQPDHDDDPQIELGPVKVSGLPRWATVAIVGTGVVVAAVTAVVSHFTK